MKNISIVSISIREFHYRCFCEIFVFSNVIGPRVANQVLPKTMSENEKEWLQVELLRLFQ